MVSRSRLLQLCLQNVSISRRQLCILSSTQLPSQTASTCSTSHAPNSRLNDQEMTTRRFSSYLKPPAEFSPKKFSPKKSNLNSAKEVNPHIIDDVRVKLDYVTSEFDLIVTKLTPNITEKALNDHFSRYGELRRCEIKEDVIKPGVRTGFVGFWSEEEVLQALADRPHTINGKMVYSFQNNQQFSVFVENLPSSATDDMLFQTFSKYGKLVHWEVKRSRDQNRNRSLGCGYVSFETAEQAIQAVNGGPLLNGRTLKVVSSKGQSLSKKSIKYTASVRTQFSRTEGIDKDVMAEMCEERIRSFQDVSFTAELRPR
ncbi:RNA recognition motif domain-containing protein [Ditylenchus destructor]|nr:RNA recognition motif domain-containing protein [Ditylenchus destructor]